MHTEARLKPPRLCAIIIPSCQLSSEGIMDDDIEYGTQYTIGYLCPVEGCGWIMQKVGTVETVDTHDRKPLNPPQFIDLFGCPKHGGRYFVNGLFLTDWDQVPE